MLLFLSSKILFIISFKLRLFVISCASKFKPFASLLSTSTLIPLGNLIVIVLVESFIFNSGSDGTLGASLGILYSNLVP